jgi:hypothetical protein
MWTPRGEIVVVRREGDNRSLTGVHPVRGEARLLFDDGLFYSGMNISPDGRHFVYLSNAEATPRLFVAPMDGSWAPRPITPSGRTSYEAA